MAVQALEAYSGATIYYIGETHEGATFDIANWLREHEQEWQSDVEMDLPTWPGVHDTFMRLSRRASQEHV